MANIKISELNPLLTVEDADVLPIVDNAVTKKVTAAILRSYTQGNSVLLTGAQTIAGIKTFTSQLASSVATGTAPFSVASTTKVTNLNADLLDGLSSADFQATLSGTGIVKSTAGTISYLTDNSTNWNTAFNDKINSAAVTGSGTNTLTLTQQDAGTITATWVNGTLIREIRNNTGATLTKGTIVYISGATGNKPTVSKAIATGDSTSAQTFGFVQENIANNANGYVVVIGDLTGVDTSAFTEGDQLYLSATVAGAFTSVKQYAPNHLVYVGIVTRSHPTLGQIEVNIQNGYEMDELHNVAAQSPSNGDILQYVTSTGLWTKIAGSTTNISEGTNLYFTDARARAAISLTTTGTSGAATYTSGVLNIPQYQAVLTNPITGTGTTNYLPKFTGASALGNSILQEGTVAIGLGVTPSAWVGTSRALQIGTRAALWDSGGATLLGYNVFNDGVNKYLVTGSSMRYFMSDGGHTWNIAPSGTAGDAITFTSAMTLNASGKLGIGTTAPNGNLGIGVQTGLITTTGITLGSVNANIEFIGSAFGSGYGAKIYQNGERALSIAGRAGTTVWTDHFTVLDTGFVGLGTITPNEKLEIKGTTTGVLRLSSTSFSYNLFTNNADGGFYLRDVTNSANRLIISSTGAATFSSSVSVGTGLALSAGTAPSSGIQFPATQVASASANNLDDYEEGTWTPTITFDGAIGQTYALNAGTYTKVGRQVTVNGIISFSNKGTSVGTARLSGLPFTITNTTGHYSSPSMRFDNITFTNQFQGYGIINQTNIQLEQITSLGVSSVLTNANFANNSAIIFTFTYFA
jgi:hypothetical protein